MPKGSSAAILLKASGAGDSRAFAALLTYIDKAGPSVLRHAELLNPSRLALRIGVTGPPGAGKSSLIDRLIGEYRGRGLRVGVLAVDPSSPFTGGAILGDRIRYRSFALDPGVFVRSIGTRGSLGGLCASAYLMLRAFDHAGFDIVLVETVGVGQTELEIVNVADVVGVVLVPESGDSIQAMKAGLMEIADVFVVNKADRDGADSIVRELQHAGEAEGEPPRVLKTIATAVAASSGVRELVTEFDRLLKDGDVAALRWSSPRLQAEARALLRWKIEQTVLKRTVGIKSLKDLAREFSSDSK